MGVRKTMGAVDEERRRAWREEAVRAAYDSLAPEYDSRFVRRVDKAENAVVAEWLEGLEREPLLDLACGTGLLLELLPVSPEGYLGVDISEEMLRQARAKFPRHQFTHASMREYLLHEGPMAFSTVVSLFGSFSYDLEPHETLRGISKVLTPGGSLALMLYRDAYWERPSYVAGDMGLAHYPWTADKIAAALDGHGFRDIQVRGLNWQGDRLGRVLPTGTLTRYLRAESRLIHPDWGWFLLAQARKRRSLGP